LLESGRFTSTLLKSFHGASVQRYIYRKLLTFVEFGKQIEWGNTFRKILQHGLSKIE
jgi:hypothetical protein